ncbi:hypothetical protein HanIR_Chr11g0558891 [Helianthus annuus]|nr:hypothetical protein HanIR_Chr11g0558891 [Helianthus annuus]
MNLFTGWMMSQRWPNMKQLFEFWIRPYNEGKPSKPNVSLYNHYLRANLMLVNCWIWLHKWKTIQLSLIRRRSIWCSRSCTRLKSLKLL